MTDSAPALANPDFPRLTWGARLMVVVLFTLTLALYTRDNTFPFSYHPDEGGKVVQVLVGSRNYHHPLLLLSATACVTRVAFIPREPQATVEAGRWVSAAFAAGSVVALALLAWWNYGLLIGWGAGLAVAFQEDLFEMAHYMKEDPALLCGLSLALFAAQVWWRRPGRASLLFLAIACGLAASGKYLGIVALTFALPLVIWHRASDPILMRATRVKTFAVAFLITFLICNFPVFGWHVSSPFRSIGNEMHGVAGGHQGLTRKVPHAEYLVSLKNKVPPVLAGLAAVYALALLATARRRTPPEWVTLLFPLGYLALISCSPKIAERYLLPVSAMVPLLAALGTGEIGRVIDSPGFATRGKLRSLASVALLGATIWAEWPAFHRTLDGFQHDDPTAVAQWIKTNLPPDAIIAEDHRVNLSATKADGLSTDARVPQKVLDASFAPELGTLDQLRSKGVGYVAVCRQNYGRYFNDKTVPQSKVKLSYDQARDFYTRLFAEGQLLKEWPKGTITYLQPGIRLYRIGQPSHSMIKSMVQPPRPFSCTLVHPSGTVAVIAERAIYKLSLPTQQGHDEAIIAFYDGETKQSWIGMELPIYVATSHGIIGLVPWSANISIFKPLTNNTGMATNFPHLWAAFDQDLALENLGQQELKGINLRPSLGTDFGSKRPNSSQMGTPKINGVLLKGGQIIMDVSSEGGDFRANVVVDENTLKLISATLVK